MASGPAERRLRSAVLVLAAYTFVAGLVSFSGWAFDVEPLTAWDGRGISIQPNSTVAAMLVGAALVAHALGLARVGRLLGAATAALGLTLVAEWVFGFDAGIDGLLLFGRTWGSQATVAPGRMGPPASASWTLLGVGVMLLGGGTLARRMAVLAGLGVTGIAGLSLIGYLFGAPSLYAMPSLTAIAFQTSTILVASGLGLLASVPERQPARGLASDGAAGILVRRTVPFILLIPLVLGLLRVRGQEMGLYGTAVGTALLVLVLIALLAFVLWWSAAAVERYERALAAAARARADADRAAADERDRLLHRTETLRQEAENANRAKDDFLAVLSHELRSPLHAMTGWLRILEDAGRGDPMVGRAVETLTRNVRSQAQVIDGLLDISRIASGKLELNLDRVDLGDAVRSAVESIRPLAASKGIDLDARAPREARLDVMGDSGRLTQIFGNVLQNAVKFTPSGGSVRVVAVEKAGRAEVVVEDTGIGIDPRHLPLVFDRFVQSQSITTRQYGGLGLGLSIVRQLTLLHAGTVRAESDGVGRGARFVLSFPLAPKSLGENPPPPPNGTIRRLQPPLDVLLVEDDPDARDALALALAAHGASVRAVESVRGALGEFAARRPDIVISDIAMPEEDGFALIRSIRELEAGSGTRTRAIAITGFTAQHDRAAALGAGFDDHVGKPVGVEDLLERIARLVVSNGADASEPRSGL